jgi:hypothetical protein
MIKEFEITMKVKVNTEYHRLDDFEPGMLEHAVKMWMEDNVEDIPVIVTEIEAKEI